MNLYPIGFILEIEPPEKNIDELVYKQYEVQYGEWFYLLEYEND